MTDADLAGPADGAPSLILAASENLAREYRERANLALADTGKTVWEAPRIHGFSSWVIECWTRAWPDEQLLSAAQEIAVWRDIIERDPVGETLLSSVGAAREARRTDELLRRHSPGLTEFPARTEEERAFVRWRAAFEQRKKHRRWLTQPEIAIELARMLTCGEVPVPCNVRLVGFAGDRDAGERAIFDALRLKGCRVDVLIRKALPAGIERRQCLDELAQFREIAFDIRHRLANAPQAKPPRVLIALPDPESRRDLLESCLQDIVAPWVTDGQTDVPWRWDVADRLANHPLIDAMLTVLRLRLETNEAEWVSRLLLSPVIWTEAERASLAAMDWQFRKLGWAQISLLACSDHLKVATADDLSARFSAFADELRASAARELPSQWAVHFRSCLAAIGWPGSAPLDSRSFQALGAGMSLLDQLGTLDEQLGKIPRSSARHWLSELAASARFSPRVEHAQPILIADLASASHLSADILYVADASTDAVPGAARPAAFVPVSLQREIGIPEASADLVLENARATAADLLAYCAAQVRVSTACMDSKGAELRPSPLFGGPEKADWESTVASPTALTAIELFVDGYRMPDPPESDPVPAMSESELSDLRFGSGLFRAWFEAPFFAFCRYRLGIEPLPAPGVGLEARDQGVLVHAVLEAFWQSTRDSHRLSALDEAALAAQISRHVDDCADRLLPPQHFGPELRRLEMARAGDLVFQWLSHEKKRLDPFSVEGCEVPAEPRISGLQLRLVLDRVDRVQTPFGERCLLLDYKTGRNAPTRRWRSAVLAEPQLPLYACHAVPELPGLEGVDGICFAHVKDGHPALIEDTNWRKQLNSEAARDRSEDWVQMLHAWRVAIDDAAAGFVAGSAWLEPGVNERSHYSDLLSLAPKYVADESDV